MCRYLYNYMYMYYMYIYLYINIQNVRIDAIFNRMKCAFKFK